MIRLLVTSGRGPAECRMAVAGIVPILMAEAEAAGLDCDRVDGPWPDRHGPSSVAIVLSGAGAESFAAGWTGSVQWIATSPVRPHHRRRNWFIGISVLDAATEPKTVVSERDVRFETLRAGGPGGQHQNKTESAVRAVHGPSGLTVVVRSERSQHRNKSLALERLGDLMATRQALEALALNQRAQAAHDQLERGRARRQFSGPDFRALGAR